MMASCGVMTVTVAVLLVVPAPVSVELIAPVVLFFAPVFVPFTLTTMVQEPPAAIAPPVNLTWLDPAVAVTLPWQTPLRPLGVATTSPAGKLSVNATPVSARLAFGLLIENVKLVELLTMMVDAPKALL